MSRRIPPASTAASCRSSPTRRTLPPTSSTNRTTRARSWVPAMPASSMITRLRGPSWAIQSGMLSAGRGCAMSLAIVSVRSPSASRSTAAAAADGARPSTCPPSSRQAAASTCSAVVLPVPAAARASWHRAPELGELADQNDLAGVEAHAVRGRLEQGQVERPARLTARPLRCAAASRICCSALHDRVAGELVSAGHPVDAAAVRAAQPGRHLDRVRVGDRDRVLAQASGHDPVNRFVQPSARDPEGARLPLGFGAHMPYLPRGAARRTRCRTTWRSQTSRSPCRRE